MKKCLLPLSTLLLIFTFQISFAQQEDASKNISDWKWDDENIYRKQLTNDGIPAATVEKLVAKRKELILSGRNVSSISHSLDIRSPQNPATQALCSDMGGENGWGAWVAKTGTNTPPITWSAPLSPPTSPNFNLTSGLGIDACTPGPNPGDPPIPVVAPNFGNSSIQIGQLQNNGSSAEQLTYPLTVTVQDSNFVFAYAAVIEDPSHAPIDQPFVSFCIYDSNGNQIPCGCFKYTAGPSIPGFYTSACNINSVSYYKPWTTVGVNLSAYIGQTLTIEIINADCTLSGHFAHSYWDFSCGTFSSPTSSTYQFCAGEDSLLITATLGAGYAYNWTSVPPGFSSTNDSIIVDPSVYNTIVLNTIPPSGCGYYQVFVLIPTNINAGFTFNNGTNCNNVLFTDTTIITGGTISNWSWSFPGGSPSSSTLQNPTITYNTPGTYTVTLIVTSVAGCMDTATSVITIGQNMMLTYNITNATTPTCCDGSATVTASGGTPPYTFLWSNGCMTVPCTGLCTGTYTVSVTDASGCNQTALLTISCVTGIDENNTETDFIISPNPFSSTTTLRVNSNLHNATLTLYNSYEQQVKQLKNIYGQEIKLQRDNLPSGLYFIRLTQEDKTFATDKLVITD